MRPRRLSLIPATFELLDGAIRLPETLGLLLHSATIAEGWEGFPEALPVLRDSCAGAPASDWGPLLFVLTHPRTLIGLGGFKGAPTPEGVVEIGYAIAPAFRGRGLATEATLEMVTRAFSREGVTAVDAHTLAEPNPSTRVLEKLGFQRITEIEDANDGPVWRWRLRRADDSTKG